MKSVRLIATMIALLGASPLWAQVPNALQGNQKQWQEIIKKMSTASSATADASTPQFDSSDSLWTPRPWDGQPQIVEEDVYDPPAPYFQTAQYYRILTPVTFTATKGEDYQKPTAPGNAAEDYWNLCSGAARGGRYDLFVQATSKRNCDFSAIGKITDPFGYENDNIQFAVIGAFFGAVWGNIGEEVRAKGPRVKMELCHRMLTMADHLESQQMNMHWAWMAYRLRRAAANGLVDYYNSKGDTALAQKYQRYSAQALTYYRTLRRRCDEVSRAFVEGDVEQFRAYVMSGPNLEIRKDLLLWAGIMLRVAEEMSTSAEISTMGSMPGWPSLKVLRYTKINKNHYEAIHKALSDLADPKNPTVDPAIRGCADWALNAEQDSLVSKLRERNHCYLTQILFDPMETQL